MCLKAKNACAIIGYKATVYRCLKNKHRNNNERGTHMITIKQDRTAYIPELDRHIGFEKDHLVETRYFEITAPELFEFSFKLDIENTSDIVDLAPVGKTDGHLVLAWNITEGVLGDSGVVTAQLRAFNREGTRVWHSACMEFIVGHSVGAVKEAETERNLSEFEQLETRVQAAVLTAESAGKSAADARDEAAAALEDIQQTAEQFESLTGGFEEIAASASAHYADTQNPHAVSAAQVGAYGKNETDSLLAGKAPAVHTHDTLPGAVTVGSANGARRHYDLSFDNTVRSFSDLTITGATEADDFGIKFAPKNRTESSRWIRISASSARMPALAETPYTLSLTLDMDVCPGIEPPEIMGLYKTSSGTDVRVTPVSSGWYQPPGQPRVYAFTLPSEAGNIRDAGFSIDLRAANAALYDSMRFSINRFTVIPSVYLPCAKKPTYISVDDRFVFPLDESFPHFGFNHFWYEEGAVRSMLYESIGHVNQVAEEPEMVVSSVLGSLINHQKSSGNPHATTAEDIGAAALLHEHEPAEPTVDTDFSGVTVTCSPYEPNLAVDTVLSPTFDEASSVWTFPNDQYYSFFALFKAGDRVSAKFVPTGRMSLRINQTLTDGIYDPYVLPETLLTEPIYVYTEFGAKVNVKILSASAGQDGYMSAADKTLLRALETRVKELESKVMSV